MKFSFFFNKVAKGLLFDIFMDENSMSTLSNYEVMVTELYGFPDVLQYFCFYFLRMWNVC